MSGPPDMLPLHTLGTGHSPPSPGLFSLREVTQAQPRSQRTSHGTCPVVQRAGPACTYMQTLPSPPCCDLTCQEAPEPALPHEDMHTMLSTGVSPQPPGLAPGRDTAQSRVPTEKGPSLRKPKVPHLLHVGKLPGKEVPVVTGQSDKELPVQGWYMSRARRRPLPASVSKGRCDRGPSHAVG